MKLWLLFAVGGGRVDAVVWVADDVEPGVSGWCRERNTGVQGRFYRGRVESAEGTVSREDSRGDVGGGVWERQLGSERWSDG